MQSVFVCIDEFKEVYRAVVAAMESGEGVSALARYYRTVLRARAGRRLPLAVELTFEILCFFSERPRLSPVMLDEMFVATGMRVFKILSQIVDLNQQSKRALSFSHILKQIGFRHFHLLAHLRNAFFHQETPNRHDLETAFRLLLGEVKSLFWDKNYYWCVHLTAGSAREVSGECEKYKIQPLTKAELHDVDEYSDMCLAQIDLKSYLEENAGRPVHSEAMNSYLKLKVKGLHRKVMVGTSCAFRASRMLRERVGRVEKENGKGETAGRQESLEQVLGLTVRLAEIFNSNQNMHGVLDSAPLCWVLPELILLESTLSGESALLNQLRHMHGVGKIESVVQESRTDQQSEAGSLGKRKLSDLLREADQLGNESMETTPVSGGGRKRSMSFAGDDPSKIESLDPGVKDEDVARLCLTGAKPKLEVGRLLKRKLFGEDFFKNFFEG